MRGNNICFHYEIRKIIFELSSIPLLSGALVAPDQTSILLQYCGSKMKFRSISTMAQMAHFSSPYYFTIPNSEFRILNSEICTMNFGIRNCEVYVMCASGNR